MLHHQIIRHHAGIILDGEQIDLHLIPNEQGKISISVVVAPSLSGFDRACRLTSCERPHDFRPGEIAITDNTITCMSANEIFPGFKEGFTCPLEPGMAPLLRTWLPQLEQVARIGAVILEIGHSMLINRVPPVYASHTYGAFPSFVSAIVLDKCSYTEAIVALHNDSLYGREPAMFSVLASDAVQAQLAEVQMANI